MDRINDFLEKWRRGLFLLALIAMMIGGAGIQAAISMVPWIGIVIALEFAFGWVWLEDYTLWVFGAAVIAWLPYDLALVLKTKDEADKQEWAARQQAYQSGLKATEASSASDA
ncbi:hypothetical protein N0B44_28740 [Roseibacterium beibuensis]|uniref:hypothetical protein n=1 Tax=[Roseibacterium] beibuensis TaxID=1193142 RepID=UPI00217EE47C|nr:hypothetical protein [Roseibacterium beibuensis]MCS6626911.1 hypothetical protein [Roseibacterium beibuensis]